LLLASPLILALFLGALACVLGPAKQVGKHFVTAAFLSFIGVILPLAVFFLSSYMVPEWKGACEHGWIDCFHLGKLALTPLVLWAMVSLYATDMCHIPPTPFMVMGIFTGAIVSSVCFVFGIISCTNDPSLLFLLVPLCTSVWYGIRAGQLLLEFHPKLWTYLWTAMGSLPFWIGSIVWCRKTYLSLPDVAPSCFIVTAATKGHRHIVGPFVAVSRHGQPREANAQLLIFWQLEASWRKRAPSSHAMFRKYYNRFGPRLARRIGSPWLADAAYLALKPAEIMARVMLSSWAGKTSQTPHCQVWTY
jgi:hypothetical protein